MSRSRGTAVVLAVVAVVSVAGCTDDEPTAGPAVVPSAAGSLPAPPAAPGELARVVLVDADRQATAGVPARAEQDYWVHASCTAAAPGRTLIYEVHSGTAGSAENAVSGGDIPCDGQVSVTGVGELPAGPIVISLQGDQTGVTSAYAIVAASS